MPENRTSRVTERAGGRSSGTRGRTVLLRPHGGYTILRDTEGVVLQDTMRGRNRPAYFADLAGALAEVFERQVVRRLAIDERKDLAALRDAIEETREEFREILSMTGVSKHG